MPTDDEYFGRTSTSSSNVATPVTSSVTVPPATTRGPEVTAPITKDGMTIRDVRTNSYSVTDSNPTGEQTMTGRTPEILTTPDNRTFSGFSGNCLNSYEQVAYHWRLYCKGENGGGEAIIAETGITGFNIRDVRIKSLIAPNPRNRSTIGTQITISIAEPMGTAFLDAMFVAVNKLQVKNWQKIDYYLELTFKAYDENGNPVKNPAASVNNGKWEWRIQIIDIETNLDAAGSTYTIQAIPYSETALDHAIIRTKEPYSITANTVEEFFKALADSMNKTEKREWGDPIVTYAFKFHPFENANPGTFKLKVANDIDHNSIRNDGMNEDKKKIARGQIIRGSALIDIIESVIGATEEGQKYSFNKDGKKDDEQAMSGDFREAAVFRIYPEVQRGKFDPLTNQYRRNITYHVKGYVTQRTTMSAKESANAKANGDKALKSLMQSNGLKKKYDYIHTGLNTEVLHFDIKHNFAWSGVLPRLQGWGYHNESLEVQARYYEKARKQLGELTKAVNDSASAQDKANSLQEQITPLKNQFDDVTRKIGSLAGRDGSALSSLMDQQASLKSQLDGLMGERVRALSTVQTAEERIAALTPEVSGARKELETRMNQMAAAAGASPSGKFYVEESLDGPGEQNPSMVSLVQSIDGARNAAGTGVLPAWDRKRALYGALLDQMYQPMTEQGQQITIQIKGDPYWLGEDYDKWASGTGGNTLPDYTKGDICFALRFRYPYGFGDDDNPTFRDHSVFNGVYIVYEVEHEFSNGQFKQTLSALRNNLINSAIVSTFGNEQ